MTIKVLSRGVHPNLRTYKGTCHRCKSVIQFDQRDAKVTYDQRDHVNFVSIECPVCKEHGEHQLIHANIHCEVL